MEQKYKFFLSTSQNTKKRKDFPYLFPNICKNEEKIVPLQLNYYYYHI